MCFSFSPVYDMIAFHKLKEISAMPRQQGKKEIAANRKAFHDYFILERFEAGIVLAMEKAGISMLSSTPALP